MTAVLLTAPFLSAPVLSGTASASPSDRTCESARTEHKCEEGKG